jgi:hypothetical protein
MPTSKSMHTKVGHVPQQLKLWSAFLAEFRKKYPNEPLSEIMKMAKKPYHEYKKKHGY